MVARQHGPQPHETPLRSLGMFIVLLVLRCWFVCVVSTQPGPGCRRQLKGRRLAICSTSTARYVLSWLSTCSVHSNGPRAEIVAMGCRRNPLCNDHCSLHKASTQQLHSFAEKLAVLIWRSGHTTVTCRYEASYPALTLKCCRAQHHLIWVACASISSRIRVKQWPAVRITTVWLTAAGGDVGPRPQLAILRGVLAAESDEPDSLSGGVTAVLLVSTALLSWQLGRSVFHAATRCMLQLHPPTAVTHCVEAYFTHAAGQTDASVSTPPNLVIARGTRIEVHSLKWVASTDTVAH